MELIHDTKVEAPQAEWYPETAMPRVDTTVTYIRHQRIPLVYHGKIQKKTLTPTPTHITNLGLLIEERNPEA